MTDSENKSPRNKPKILSFSGIVILIIFFLDGFFSGTYAGLQAEAPAALRLGQIILLIWAIGWWIKNDSRERGIGYISDLGFLLYVAWPIVIAHYLFKTRGWKGLLLIAVPIGVFIIALIAGTLLGVIGTL